MRIRNGRKSDPHEFEMQAKRAEVEYIENWREWCRKIPPIHFKQNWGVKIIPPFANALARFHVSYKDKEVSVYFDGYSNLGYMYDEQDKPIPYYELYPYEGDIKRYTLDQIEELEKDMESVLEGDA